MAKLKTSRIVKVICDTCHGNGYVRVAKTIESLANEKARKLNGKIKKR